LIEKMIADIASETGSVKPAAFGDHLFSLENST
jgi:hypothetical protein